MHVIEVVMGEIICIGSKRKKILLLLNYGAPRFKLSYLTSCFSAYRDQFNSGERFDGALCTLVLISQPKYMLWKFSLNTQTICLN